MAGISNVIQTNGLIQQWTEDERTFVVSYTPQNKVLSIAAKRGTWFEDSCTFKYDGNGNFIEVLGDLESLMLPQLIGQARGTVMAATNPLTGGIELSAGGSVIGFTEQFPQRRIKFATFGDSLSDIGTVNNVTSQNIGQTTAANTPVTLGNARSGASLQVFSRGILTPVFNGGVGGETTTQIATRSAAASSMVSTSKALIDAQTFGAEFVIFTAGINDFASFTTATSAATIEAAQATALANLKACIKKAKSLGLFCVFHNCLPYGSAPLTANQMVVNQVSRDYNAQVNGYLQTMPEVALYYDARSYVEAADGGWVASLSAENTNHTHPCLAGAYLAYRDLSKKMLAKFGMFSARHALPKGQNMFSNADLSASAGGLATGISIAQANGTTVTSIVEEGGINKQKIVFTPTNANGVDSALIFDITASVAGASPFVPVAVNDVLGVEYDLEISNAEGGPANVYSIIPNLRKLAGATATVFSSMYGSFGGIQVKNMTNAFSERISGGFLVIDEATSASSGAIYSRLTLYTQVSATPIHVTISNIRFVKLPVGY